MQFLYCILPPFKSLRVGNAAPRSRSVNPCPPWALAAALFCASPVLAGQEATGGTGEGTAQGASAEEAEIAKVETAGDPPHPAHIHKGACKELGGVANPLDAVAVPEDGEVVGSPGPTRVATSVNTVDVSLQEILDRPHAINVHLSKERINRYIACGSIGGIRREDGGVSIELRQVDESGFFGTAYLTPNEKDPNQTDVFLFLVKGEPRPTVEDEPPAGG